MDPILKTDGTVAVEGIQQTVAYLTEKMGQFLRRGDHVLICFPTDQPSSLGSLFAEAVKRCGAVGTVWGPDYRWKTLLRQAFNCRAGTIIAPPLVILGLTKLARAKATPLYIRNVMTAGYPCTDWMIEGIRGGLDCKSWGCFDVLHEVPVAGFSCAAGWGVHLNSREFDLRIRDGQGNDLPDDTMGEVVLRSRRNGAVVRTYDRARISAAPCKCGSTEPLLMDIALGPHLDPELIGLSNSINRWTSVLDCRVTKGQGGLEIEIVVFPGEQLPKLPSCARLIIRPWNPEEDAPFYLDVHKVVLNSIESVR